MKIAGEKITGLHIHINYCIEVEVLRTPEERFENLPDFDYKVHEIEVDGMRMSYLDKGIGATVLLLHGEPTWSFLYRTMLKKLVKSGYRVIVPDLIGFGRSDKPTNESVYTYANHYHWLKQFVEKLNLDQINLFCQDWGGLLGLRLVAFEQDRFSRVMASNTFLPNGENPLPESFVKWRHFASSNEDFDIGKVVMKGTLKELPNEVHAAYNAPFPEERYKVGARMFPKLVPESYDDPEAVINRMAWEKLSKFDKPFLTCFGDSDPITAGGGKVMQERIPGCKGLFHPIVSGAGHFIQEDKPEVLATIMANFIKNTK